MRFPLHSNILRLLRYKTLIQYYPKKKRAKVIAISLLCLILFLVLRYGRTGQHVFVSSAYYVRDSGTNYSQDVVRLLILSENGLKRPNLYCELDGQLVRPIINYAFGEPICKWKTYFMDCPVTERPHSLALVNSNNDMRHKLELVQVDTTPRQLVVCFSRLYFFDEWQVALSAIEIYRQHGADLMVIPIISLVDQLYIILKAHERAGTVRLKPGTLIPKLKDLGYNPNAEVEWLNHIITHTECMYDYRETADFILNVDIEEVLFPRTGDLKAELYALASEFPNAASFEFLVGRSYSRAQNVSSEFELLELVSGTHIETLFDNGTSVVRPKRVQMVFKYATPLKEHLVPGYEHRLMTENDSLMIKYWKLRDDNFYIPSPNTYISKMISKYEDLDNKMHEFLNKNPAAKQAFFHLPTMHNYSDPIDNCILSYEALKVFGWNYGNCPNPSSCKLFFENTTSVAPCITVQPEIRQTQLSGSLKIISVDSHSYPLNSDCRSEFADTLL